MNVRLAKSEQLSGDEIAAWSAIQRAHSEFHSPFFRPEFTQLVAAVRDDVEVAVLESAGEPVGFFPFQRSRSSVGKPIANGVCDYQGLIAPADVECDALELLRKCQLTTWRFDHLVPAHNSFAQFAWSDCDSPYIDLPNGFDDYLRARDNGTSMMADYRRKKRRIEREYGPLRYEPHVADANILAKCLEWKAMQVRRMGGINGFARPWIDQLLHKLLACQSDEFSGAMPVCYVGDRIAAINFGMLSGGVFYSWMPTYDQELAACSPGLLHFVEMMQVAESHGIRRIILGRGGESYKQRFMNGADRVAQGCVDTRPAFVAARRAWRQTRDSIKASPFHAPARVPVRIVNRITSWLAFR